ncbi:hypothetical protein QR680_011495 [Steinernema hermaphroditum]|uniref:Peptidase S1 domain-containing protein n=1 Tax=Steinernema hermaphroditum TaxID=289476 RepID=A0AA39LZ27_9BILA|nr:hypothetical protein QR680_011495 [Steinernema hermaphroditum]
MRFLLLSSLVLIGLSLAAPPAPPVVQPPKHSSSELIYGGHRAYGGAFPYYVYLHSCGGSLISPKHILTAAHCLVAIDVGETAVMGLDDNEEYEKQHGVQIRTIVKIFEHPRFNDTAKQADIAILEVDKPFELSPYVQLSNIKSSDTELQKLYWTTAVGFGLDVKNGTEYFSPRYLQYTYIPLIDMDYCTKFWWQFNLDKHICAGAQNSGVLNGDSGGPLSVNDNGKQYQLGIVSFNARGFLDEAKYPAVFTRTSSFCDWMTETTKGAFHCD